MSPDCRFLITGTIESLLSQPAERTLHVELMADVPSIPYAVTLMRESGLAHAIDQRSRL
jgi:hypothetical protein